MKATELDYSKVKQQINLIDGAFTTSEASDIIKSVLDIKINFHKLHRLSITEGDNSNKCVYDSSRIDELMNEKEAAKNFLKQAKFQGKKLKMSSIIHISLED